MAGRLGAHARCRSRYAAHREAALDRVRELVGAHPEVSRWVVSGHSLGGALAARFARSDAKSLAALVLIGTTHPKQQGLAALTIPVTKVYASNDGVAPPDRVLANRQLLPGHARWVEVPGGNHSQFGLYGQQLFDGTATATRERQEAITRAAIVDVLTAVPATRSAE